MKKKSYRKLTKHHRLPSSRGGTSNPENISMLSYETHQAWHLLFSNHTAQTICAIINERYLDPEFEFKCERRKNDDQMLLKLS
jgi:hypothetical protein